jgi:2',3'-cyclic-nucleotide 2'-phosphodiesterase (5'-nucleotidase family)
MRIFILSILLILTFTAFSHESLFVINSNINGQLADYEMNDMAQRIGFSHIFNSKYPRSIYIDLGNFLGPDYLSLHNLSEPVIQGYNLSGMDIVNLGKHDFHSGIKVLSDRIEDADFQFISSNLKLPIKGVKPFHRMRANGNKFFFIGLCSAFILSDVNVDHLSGVKFIPYQNALNNVLKEAKDDEIIVLLDNLSMRENSVIAEKNPRIDLILYPKNTKVDLQKIGKTSMIGVAQGLKASSVVSIAKSGDIPIVSTTDFLMKEYPPFETFREYQTELRLAFERQDEVLTWIEKADTIPMVITNALRQITQAEIACINVGYFREGMFNNTLTKADLGRMMPFKNRYCTLKLTGKELAKLYNFSQSRDDFNRMLLWAGVEKKGGKILVNGRALVNNERYHVATLDFLKKGGDGYSIFKNKKIYSDSSTLLQDDLKPLFSGRKEISLSDFDYYNHRTKRTQNSSLDVSFTEVTFNENRDHYTGKNISSLSGSDKRFFQGRLQSKILFDRRKDMIEHKIRADIEKQSNQEESNKLQVISRHIHKFNNFQSELKVDTSWNKLQNERYPLTVNLSFLRKTRWKWFQESRMGISGQKNFVNQDESAGMQFYLKNRITLFHLDLNSYLDYYQGLTGLRPSVIELQNRMRYPLSERLSWFMTWRNYFYRDKEIEEWGNQQKLYSGLTLKWDSKKF